MLPIAPAGASVSVMSAPVGEAFQLTTAPSPDTQQEAWGDWVVYRDHSDPSPDVWAVNVNDGQPFPILTRGGAQNNPSIYGDIIVHHSADLYWSGSWSKEGNVWGYNMVTGEEFPISVNDEYCSANPFIWGDWVVYTDQRDGDGDDSYEDVYAYNLSTGVESVVSTDTGYQRSPAAWGDKCVYHVRDASYTNSWLEVTDLKTGETTSTPAEANYKYSPNIYGDWAVYQDSGNNVVAWNYVSGESTVVATTGGNSVDIWEDIVVWEDYRTGDGDDSNGDIYMMDLSTGVESVVCTDSADQSRVRISEGAITWVDHRNDNGTDNPDLYCMYLEPKTTSMAGATRYETACEVSKANFPGGADAVVIATGENWPDALAASALAGAADAPLLFVRSSSVPPAVASELGRLGASEAYIIGGTGAISAAVEGEIATYVGGNTNRLAGDNRYATSQQVAEEVAALLGGDFDGTAMVATGRNFPDAVAASAVSAGMGWPLFLTETDSFPGSNIVTMEGIGVDDVFVVGGTGAISAGVMTAIDAKFGDVERLSGATRYDTALAIAEAGVDAGMTWDGVAFATGTNFPDALIGGVVQGKANSVLLLTHPTSLNSNVEAKLKAKKDMIGLVRFLGGTGAISDAVKSKIESIVQ